MPFLHRWWGNPMFSVMARHWFKATAIHDVYCGLRGFSKEFYQRLNQRCTGMEFATEMIIKASLFREKISEVPITLHPDGRKSHPPHLRTFRDGWRTLRFFLMYSPRWLFVVPGILLILFGLIGYGLAMPGAFWRRDFRCSYPVVCELGSSLRLSINSVRNLYQDLCCGRGTDARGSSIYRVFPDSESRARLILAAGGSWLELRFC
jgi:hypothetical protein